MHPLTLVAVWSLGSVAAIARNGSDSTRAVITGGVLAVVAMSVIWLLRVRVGPRQLGLDGAAVAALFIAGVAAVRVGFVYPLVVVVLGTVLAVGALVRWSLPASWPQRRSGIAGVAIGPLLAAELLWYREGSPTQFLMLCLLTLGVLEVYARRPSTADTVDRAIDRVARAVAAAITYAATGIVMVLVVLPVHLVSRLFRYDPLDGGWTSSSSAWVAVEPARLRSPAGDPARPDSMAMLELRPTPRVRRRGHLRLVVPALAVAVFAVVSLPGRVALPSFGSESASAPGADRPDTFTRAFEEDPAFEDAPWARTLRMNLLDTWNNLEFNAALGGWQIKDVTSDHINVEGGERSTVAPDPALGDPIDVWFLGGSAAFGAGQRDEHTIPSELVRRAGRDGIPLEVHNLAVPATVNWQSAMLLIARLQWEDPPDLVVVYDGANDLALQDALADQGKGGSDRPASLIDAELDAILRERAEVNAAAVDALPVNEEVTPDVAPTPTAAGRLAFSRYVKGIDVMRQFASVASVPVSIFWQPDLRAKQPLTDDDRSTLAAVNVDDEAVERWTLTSDAAREGLAAAGVVDLTSVFDGESRPVFWDTVHTNEVGALLVADAMYRELEPTLRGLQQRPPSATGGG